MRVSSTMFSTEGESTQVTLEGQEVLDLAVIQRTVLPQLTELH